MKRIITYLQNKLEIKKESLILGRTGVGRRGYYSECDFTEPQNNKYINDGRFVKQASLFHNKSVEFFDKLCSVDNKVED